MSHSYIWSQLSLKVNKILVHWTTRRIPTCLAEKWKIRNVWDKNGWSQNHCISIFLPSLYKKSLSDVSLGNRLLCCEENSISFLRVPCNPSAKAVPKMKRRYPIIRRRVERLVCVVAACAPVVLGPIRAHRGPLKPSNRGSSTPRPFRLVASYFAHPTQQRPTKPVFTDSSEFVHSTSMNRRTDVSPRQTSASWVLYRTHSLEAV